MRSNLVLHCGASRVEREQVYGVPTPPRTKTWVPVAHGLILDQVQRVLAGNGLEVVSEGHGLTKDGNRYFGLLQVANGHNSPDWGLVIGLRNSHDQSFPAALALGASVFVCDNLSISGTVKLSRKHSAHIERDLPQLIERAVGMLGDLRLTQERRFETYKATEFSEGQVHDLTIRALDAKVVPVTKIPAVIQEWREPRHPEFREGRSAWRFFNAVTECLKGNLTELPRRTQALHGLLDGATGLVVPQGYKTEDAEIVVAQAG